MSTMADTYVCGSCDWSGGNPAAHESRHHDGAQTCWTDAEWRAGERTAGEVG